ncbi:diguanylate cyclase domain-containing protein [Cryptosporangium aurantiacum]|uniref:Diguanylate cyclase (GGDEF) domain-containing protein n=1 Tax=Cryptosporangium aurantiacum TaxID=134849 RepID=A0A1M7RN61_9ACTN|nr:diguanylate cyclase [Cryptosporangium aurantiacum]SHN47641.1 diguanylate cyclase (GGDEF) domain-containing protein [Cryptosporangium aurantiacum]
MVLATGGLVTATAFTTVERGERLAANQLMDRYADELSAAISDRTARYAEALNDLAAAVGAQSDLRKDDFTRITAGLTTTRMPGSAGISFVVPATPSQIPAVQRHWRALGATDLTLRPAAGTSRHAFVVYERSFDALADVPGIDLTQSPQPAEALLRAWQGHTLAVSTTFQLLRDQRLAEQRRQPSFVFAAPVYAAQGLALPDRFHGWVVMPVRGQDFLSRTLLDRGQGAVQVSVTEGRTDGTVLTAVRPGRRVDDASLVRHRTLFVGQRRWQMTAWPTTDLLAATDRGMSRLTLAAGTALTLMLGAVTGVLAGSRSHALHQVDQATTALRRDIARREHVEAQLREREQQLHHLAFHDPLTGIANRALLYDRLTHALLTQSRSGHRIALLYIDLDGFKAVNDQLGHHAGDTVLRAVADRLCASVRAADTVARLGGDEFAILLEGCTTTDAARVTAERVIAEVRAPIDLAGTPAHVSASIGIAVSHPGDTADDLVRVADAAMYSAKDAGKNRYVEAAHSV